MAGLSTTGSISLGMALVAGRNLVPSPAAGITALRTEQLVEVTGLIYPREHSYGKCFRQEPACLPLRQRETPMPTGTTQSKDGIRSRHREIRATLTATDLANAGEGIASHGLPWAEAIAAGKPATFTAYLGV